MTDNINSLLIRNIDVLVTMDEERRVIKNGWLYTIDNRQEMSMDIIILLLFAAVSEIRQKQFRNHLS